MPCCFVRRSKRWHTKATACTVSATNHAFRRMHTLAMRPSRHHVANSEFRTHRPGCWFQGVAEVKGLFGADIVRSISHKPLPSHKWD